MTFYKYRNNYLDSNNAVPAGEHHFVAIYLVWKIYELKNIIPDYINPDGTKKLAGDLIFNNKEISFEVKLEDISFTKLQWYSWLNPTQTNNEINDSDLIEKVPTHFIGASKDGLIILDWKIFKECYNDYIKTKIEVLPIGLETKTYTPSICVKSFIKRYENIIGEYIIKSNNSNENVIESKINERFNEIFA